MVTTFLKYFGKRYCKALEFKADSFSKNEIIDIPEPASTSTGQVRARETAANQGQGRQKGCGVCCFEVCGGGAREHEVGLSNSKWNAVNK